MKPTIQALQTLNSFALQRAAGVDSPLEHVSGEVTPLPQASSATLQHSRWKVVAERAC